MPQPKYSARHGAANAHAPSRTSSLFDELRNERPPWQMNAACAQKRDADGRKIDLAWWFPSREAPEGEATKNAKRICDGCPVRAECFMEINGRSEYGIWAGMTERDRRELRIGKRLP